MLISFPLKTVSSLLSFRRYHPGPSQKKEVTT